MGGASRAGVLEEEPPASGASLLRERLAAAFKREGRFENVGPVTLARLVSMMRAHDAEHLRELTALRR